MEGEEILTQRCIEDNVLSDIEEVDKLPEINPERSGRMPLVLQAAEDVINRIGKKVFVRGAISGPFSMAAELMGIEQLLIASIRQSKAVNRLLARCADVAFVYGRAFLSRGIEL